MEPTPDPIHAPKKFMSSQVCHIRKQRLQYDQISFLPSRLLSVFAHVAPDGALAGELCKRLRVYLETISLGVTPVSYSSIALLLAEISTNFSRHPKFWQFPGLRKPQKSVRVSEYEKSEMNKTKN